MSTRRYSCAQTQPDLVESFARHGFLRSVDVFPPEVACAFADSFDALVSREHIDLLAPGFRLHDRHLDQAFVWEAAADTALLEVIASLAGPDLVLLGSRFICKPAHSELGVPWHRDAEYAGLEPATQINVWLAVDDVDADNGCLRVLPRGVSADAQVRGHVPAARERGNLVDQKLWLSEYERGKLVSLPLRAGAATIFDGDLVHGSEHNVSSRRRCGLALRYVASTTCLVNEGQWAAVGIRGTVDDQGGRVMTRDSARGFAYRKVEKFSPTA